MNDDEDDVFPGDEPFPDTVTPEPPPGPPPIAGPWPAKATKGPPTDNLEELRIELFTRKLRPTAEGRLRALCPECDKRTLIATPSKNGAQNPRVYCSTGCHAPTLAEDLSTSGIQVDPYSPPTERRGTPQILDLTQPPPPVDWMIQDLWAKGDTVFWGGAQGTAKSWGGLDLAISLARQEPWLGQFPCLQKGRTIYLDEENGSGRMFRRVEALCKPRGIDRISLIDPLTIVSKWGITDAEPENWRWFSDLCRDHEPDLIIMDTLRAVFSGDEDSSGDAQAFMRRMDALKERAAGATLLLLCHPGKKTSRGIRGSSRWTQAADVILNAVSLPGKGNVKGLAWTKVRDGAENPEPLAIKIEDMAGGVSLEPATLSASDKARETKKLHPDWTHDQVAEALSINRSTVTRALRSMENDLEDGE